MPYGDNKPTTWDKSNLPSRHVSVGPERAPHRSYYYAMGLTEEDIAQPFVGVATCWNEAAPCNIALGRQAQAVKLGVKAGAGTPREFTTITVTDGIAMGHAGMKSSLVSREVIADSVELTDARPLLRRAGRPGRLRQVAARHDDGDGPAQRARRSSCMAARSCPAGTRAGTSPFRTCSRRSARTAAGKMTDADLHELECVACPSAGSCGGQFTANTMACVSEAIGLALPGSAGAPAPYESRDAYAEASGRAVMDLIKRSIRPRDIVTRKALENAARRRRRLRRFDQCRPASAGDRA